MEELASLGFLVVLKKPVEQPSDMQGIVYLSFKESLEEIRGEIVKELKAGGYEIAESHTHPQVP